MAEGTFFFVPEHDQWDLAASARAAYDALVLRASHSGAYPRGHPSEGEDPERLLKAAIGSGRPFVIDPETPSLTWSRVANAHGSARLRDTPGAQALSQLPLQASELAHVATRDAYTDTVLAAQTGAHWAVAPYLEVTSRGDPRLEASLAMAKRITKSVGTQIPTAFVQVTERRMCRGLLAEVANPYAETGIRTVFLRVRGFQAERATVEQAEPFLAGVEAFTDAGVAVVCDRVGRFGPVAVAAGAEGFSAGAQFFRSVPAALGHSGGGGGQKLPVEIAGQWKALPRDEADGHDCPEPGCPAPNFQTHEQRREHNLHSLRNLARRGGDRAQLSAELLAAPDAVVRGWGQVLRRRYRRTA